MPITPHNSQAGKNAPNNSNEGASPNEQPVSRQLVTANRGALSRNDSVIVSWDRVCNRCGCTQSSVRRCGHVGQVRCSRSSTACGVDAFVSPHTISHVQPNLLHVKPGWNLVSSGHAPGASA